MEKDLINFMVDHQIENNVNDLELLNIQFEFYNKLLENAKTKEEKEKYQKKIQDIIQNIDFKFNDIKNLNI